MSTSLDEAQRRFLANIEGVPIPRDSSRRVVQPLSGINIVAISELFPSHAFTEAFPIIGQTTKAEMTYMNQEAPNDFDSNILWEIHSDFRDGGEFTRCTFTPPITTTYPADPNSFVKEEWETVPHYWDPILEHIEFIDDDTTQVAVQDHKGNVKYVPRIRVRYAYRPGLEAASWVRKRTFLSNVPFKRGPRFNIPQPSDVSWDIDPLGQSGSFPRCLHPKIDVPATSDASGLVGTSFSQRYPATNQLSWISYDLSFEVTESSPFFIGVLSTIFPPPLTPITKIYR